MAESLDMGVKEFSRGDMEVVNHVKTYDGVMRLLKLGALHIVVIVAFLTLWFCARAGFFPSLVVAVIIAILGGVYLATSGKHKAPSH